MRGIIPTSTHHLRKSAFFIVRLIIVLALLLQGGCDQIVNLGKNSINDVITTTQDSLDKITQESSGWRTELQNLSNELTNMEGKISSDAKVILTDTISQVQDMVTQTIQMTDAKIHDIISQAGVEFRCNADFIRQGAIDQLKAIIEDLKFWKDHGQHQNVRPNHAVCWINPSTLMLQANGYVNPNNMPDPYIMHVFGYNFWSDKLPSLELRDAAGNKVRNVNVTPAYVTHYQLNLNFSSEIFLNLGPDMKVVFNWPDKPDPNSISLVSIPPAHLTIQSITFNPGTPRAKLDLAFPRVVIVNDGGTTASPFTVNWLPAPNASLQSVSVTSLGVQSSTTVVFPGYSYPLCGNFQTNISISTGSDSRNVSISVAPYCPYQQPPASSPERLFNEYVETTDQSISPVGTSHTLVLGSTCRSGYHRSQVTTSAVKSGPGSGCYFDSWYDSNQNMCKANIRIWADAFSKVVCTIQIYEIGDPQPTPTPYPYCSCQP